MTALRASVADAPGDACEGWWTTDERYVLRVAAVGGEQWYVGELGATDPMDAAAVSSVVPRPPRETPPPRTRTMLVGRQRGHRVAPAPMRLHVRRPSRG